MNTNCATCRFAFATTEATFDSRQCRRHSPQQLFERSNASWPIVHETNWCGDWEPLTATPGPGAFPGPAPSMPPDDTADINVEQLRDFFRAIGVDPAQPADANPIAGTPHPFFYDAS